jgi:hypothetical protein
MEQSAAQPKVTAMTITLFMSSHCTSTVPTILGWIEQV